MGFDTSGSCAGAYVDCIGAGTAMLACSQNLLRGLAGLARCPARRSHTCCSIRGLHVGSYIALVQTLSVRIAVRTCKGVALDTFCCCRSVR